MRKNKPHIFSRLIAVMLCMAALSIPAFAADDYFSSDGKTPDMNNITINSSGTASVPSTPCTPIDLIRISSDGSASVNGENLDSFLDMLLSKFAGSDALTPAGNMTLVDDILQSESYSSVENEQKSKQFITVQSKNGNYFYIIVDRSGGEENVYFLNLVDESDLMALIPEAETPVEAEAQREPEVCACEDKCYAGHVDTTCALCAKDMTQCTGKEQKPEPVTPAQPEPQVETPAATAQQPDGGGNRLAMLGGVAVMVLIAAILGGAAFYFLKVKGGKPAPKTKGDTDLDDYDYGEDDADSEEAEFEAYAEDDEDEAEDGA